MFQLELAGEGQVQVYRDVDPNHFEFQRFPIISSFDVLSHMSKLKF